MAIRVYSLELESGQTDQIHKRFSKTMLESVINEVVEIEEGNTYKSFFLFYIQKFCGEIRHLASKTYKTVEKMSTKSKYCSTCGDNIGNMKKAHKECPQLLRNVVDRKKPMTASTYYFNLLMPLIEEMLP